MNVLRNSRFYILFASLLFSLGIYLYITQTIPTGILQTERVTQTFAFSSLLLLYAALFASPLFAVFPKLTIRAQYIHARRALGISAWYFAVLHASFAFFGQLGGFNGLFYLSNTYLFAIALSFTALLILSAMAVTSFDQVLKKLTHKKWKLIHRFVYLALLLIVIHALMLGTHFQTLTDSIPQICFVLLAILLIFEAIRFDRYLSKKFASLPRVGVSFCIVLFFLAGFLTYLEIPSESIQSFNVHATHIQIAKENQNGLINPLLSNSALPGLQGDRTRRFTANISAPDTIHANEDTPLSFTIYDASSGTKLLYFLKVYQYPMHLIIVDSTLSYFEHIHPEEDGNGVFHITTKFPKPGQYHLYIQFQPAGAIEQQIGFSVAVDVPPDAKIAFASQPIDTTLTKTFGDYEVTLDTHGKLSAQDMTIGKDTLTYTIKDAKTHQPITTLKPFMGAFGHLSLINEQTYDFLHVHPTNLTTPLPDTNGGPSIDFVPLGLYGSIKPGIYRAFGEFSTQMGTDFDTDFTIEIK